MKDTVNKNSGFVLNHSPTSSCSETSNLSSSDSSDTPLKRFNRLLRTSVARRWAYFRKKPRPWIRGRSVSETGLCSMLNHETNYLNIGAKHCSLLMLDGNSRYTVPSLFITSAGSSASAHGPEEASDSDAERPRTHHLRVPTPHYLAQSTGNFAAAGGGCGAPRSAPATPLQLEPHARTTKHDKHVMKPLSGSAPSVRVSALAAAEDDAAEGKVPSKSRQKKFQRHFPQVGPDERVLNYYSCALVGDLLLQGHLYITKNYFAFYSNVFGYVTKLLIPTTSVLRITKEKVARIIPNAVGVCTRDERHVFGSLLSRDSTYKLMMLVWKAARVPELAVPPPQMLRASGVELDASEYSPEDDSSSACAEPAPETRTPAGGGAVVGVGASGGVGVVGGAAVIQPALLTGGVAARRSPQYWRAALALAAALLTCSAALLAYRLLHHEYQAAGDGSGEQLYAELVRWRSRLHGRAADELHAFLNTNLLLLTKVRQSLEALSGVILTDMGHEPADTGFS